MIIAESLPCIRSVDARRLIAVGGQGKQTGQEEYHSVSEIFPDRHHHQGGQRELAVKQPVDIQSEDVVDESELRIVHDFPYIRDSDQRGYGRHVKDRAEQCLVLHQF